MFSKESKFSTKVLSRLSAFMFDALQVMKLLI